MPPLMTTSCVPPQSQGPAVPLHPPEGLDEYCYEEAEPFVSVNHPTGMLNKSLNTSVSPSLSPSVFLSLSRAIASNLGYFHNGIDVTLCRFYSQRITLESSIHVLYMYLCYFSSSNLQTSKVVYCGF